MGHNSIVEGLAVKQSGESHNHAITENSVSKINSHRFAFFKISHVKKNFTKKSESNIFNEVLESNSKWMITLRDLTIVIC